LWIYPEAELDFHQMISTNPILDHINLAREHAKLENYEASLRSYQNAKKEAEYQIDQCSNPKELPKLNTILKDLVSEELSVKRLCDIMSSILSKLDNHSEAKRIENIKDKIRQKDNVLDDKIRRIPNINDDETHKRKPRIFVKNHHSDSSSSRETKKNVGQSKPLRPAAPQQITVNNPERESIDPTTNPLVQQIIDMGILVKDPNVQWESIAGLANVKKLLRQNLVILPMRPDICKGLLSPWKSVLFYGPPGTGKTFLAKAVATECKRTFFNVTSATVTSRFLGESEKLISHLFDMAEQMSPSTIFFDEIDALASQRGGSSEHEASRRMKAQLLTRLEGIDGALENSSIFVLAATNFPWHLDEALLRRFQKRIFIPLPDLEGRILLLKMHISDLIDDDFELEMFAEKLDGYSCADIENLCRDVAQAVFDRQTANLDTHQWLTMPLEQARIIISNRDFFKGMELRKSSVDPSMLKQYDVWKSTKGAE